MNWRVSIHTIDVGQGESAIIRLMGYEGAVNMTGNPDIMRQILIDGGLGNMCGRVLEYMNGLRFSDKPVDVVVCTHFDHDHFGGIKEILLADNLYYVGMMAAAALNGAREELNKKPIDRYTRAAMIGAVLLLVFLDGTKCVAQDVLNEIASAAYTASHDVHGRPTLYDMNGAWEVAKRVVFQEKVDRWDKCLMINGDYLMPTGNPKTKLLQRIISLMERICACKIDGDDMSIKVVADIVFSVLRADYDIDEHIPADGTNGKFYRSLVLAPTDIGQQSLAHNFDKIARHDELSQIRQIFNIHRRYMSGYTSLNRYFDKCIFKDILGDDLGEGAPKISLLAVDGCVMGKDTTGRSENEVSIGLLIELGAFRFYTAGDLENTGGRNAEDVLANEYHRMHPGVTFTAVKCGHHGSKNCTSNVFLNATHPKCAVISCGVGNPFGHPNEETLDRLDRKATVRRCVLTSAGSAGTYLSQHPKFKVAKQTARPSAIQLIAETGKPRFRISYHDIEQDDPWDETIVRVNEGMEI